MTNKQMETRILNLERQLLSLATREGKRANKAESAINGNTSDIASVNSNLDTAKEGISELEDLSYSQELRITCLELGMDISELESM